MNADINQLVRGRTFIFWECRPNLSQLVLRSPKSNPLEETIDLLFVDVQFLQIPMSFVLGQLRRASAEERERIKKLIPHFNERDVTGFYAFVCGEVSHYIAAWWFGIHTHAEDYHHEIAFNLQILPCRWVDVDQ